ncbi:MAG: vanadium-dependent haloperoxidase [Pseudomonadota bacterium]|nr:vanadium-dependent haloperoxidase [Pseudomonadota bacterium]
MNSNLFWPAIFTAIACPRPAPAQARHDPGVPVGFANTAGEKAACDKRNRHRLIALALAAMFALAGSGTVKAESSLKGENAKELERLLAVPAENKAVDFAFKKPPRVPTSTLDRYLMWNEIALDTTAIDHTPVDPASGEDTRRFGEQFGPTRASYALAIVHIAMFDAENAITKRYVSYSGIPAVRGNVSLDRAIAQAARDTLIALYPFQKDRLDAIFDADTVRIAGNQTSIDAGAALGKRAAAAILKLRENDGSALPEPRWDVDYFPKHDHEPGSWQIDPISGLKVALGGNWPKMKSFVMTSADQFRAPPPPPPSLKDKAYKQAFKEAVRLGGDPAHGTTTSRTEAQTFMGRFWGYDATPNLCAPPRLYNMVARTIALDQKMLGVPEIARLFALVNVAMADAGIAAWDSKYFYQYWRPVTAIRAQSDPKFYPLGAPATNTAGPNLTPPWPAYTSGHAVFGGALFQILRQFWPDETPFTFVSDEWNGKNTDVDGNIRPLRPAPFKSFREAEWDNAQSRIYMGIHWHFDAVEGIRQGNRVANYVFHHAFRPVKDVEDGPVVRSPEESP